MTVAQEEQDILELIRQMEQEDEELIRSLEEQGEKVASDYASFAQARDRVKKREKMLRELGLLEDEEPEEDT